MEPLVAAHSDTYFHVRMIMGMVTGLSITRLLSGLARFVQHPGKEKIYPAHLLWVLFLFLSVVHFWWFEFAYAQRFEWSFLLYLFLILYAALFFFTCAVLFPDHMEEYDGFEGYFVSRAHWFYGLLVALVLVDTADTALKGQTYFDSLGWTYLLRQAVLVVGALVAAWAKSSRVHTGFAIAALLSEALLIAMRYAHLSAGG